MMNNITSFSALAISEVKDYLRVSGTDEDKIISVILASVKKFILGYTGLSEQEADSFPELTIACLVLCSDLFDNRTLVISAKNLSPSVDSILHMHCKNYL